MRQAVARAAGVLCGNEMMRVDSRTAATSVQIHFRAESVPRGGGPRPFPPGPRGGGPRLCGNQSVFTKSDSARRLREILISTPFFAVARLAAAILLVAAARVVGVLAPWLLVAPGFMALLTAPILFVPATRVIVAARLVIAPEA